MNLTPTRTGQVQLARLFVDQIMDDVKKTRKADDRVIFQGLIDLVYTIGANAPRQNLEAVREDRDKVIREIFG